MVEEPFIPLSRRGNTEAAADWRGALAGGIPAWLQESVKVLATQQLTDSIGSPNSERLRLLERALRLSLKWDDNPWNALDDVQRRLSRGDDGALDIVDFLLKAPQTRRFRADLARVLAQGGSTWSVADDHLERRVDPTLQSVVEATISADGRASDHLAVAWSAVFGRHPNSSHAFREAVKAVEAALIPVVLPRDSMATLGKVISAIRDNPAKFQVRLQPKPPLSAVEAFREMLQLLWTSQYDRHATGDETVPFQVTLPEAEDAVTLAATIVHWVNTGAFARVT